MGALKVELLVDGAAFWPRLRDDLAAARQRIFAQTLSFEGDAAGRGLADALLASRARDRRVVVDEFTRHVINDKFVRHPLRVLDRELHREVRDTERMIADLTAAGVGVRFTNPAGWFYFQLPMRNHKKLIALDGRVVYVGGINFTDHNFQWHDLMLRIEDARLAELLEQDFDLTWRGIHQEATHRLEGLEFMILSGSGNERQFGRVLDLIAGARHHVFVQSPYVAPPFSEALRQASLRGVRVVVVTAERNNWKLCHDHIHWKATTAPLELRLYPDRMTHMKAMLVDDQTLVLGSANFELWSYRFQQEYVCLFTDPDVIAGFRDQVMLPDLACSRPTDRRIGRIQGALTDLRLEWLERLALGVNGRRYDGHPVIADRRPIAPPAPAGPPEPLSKNPH